MRVLVTGAEGFAGRTMVGTLLAAGHEVLAGIRPGGPAAVPGLDPADGGRVTVASLELLDPASVDAAVAWRPEAVVHLAAVASGAVARQDVGTAWEVNAAGTARLAESLGRLRQEGAADPTLLVVSTGEVYGAGAARPRRESDPLAPCSPYAASKLGAEIAALEAWRRTGLRVVIARPFPHTGRGQAAQFVAPAFAARLRDAKRSGAASVATGNLEPVREFLHVQDVAAAYLALLAAGVPGEAYNVARGEGIALRELFDRLAAHLGVRVEPVPDPSLMRTADILHLVGDPAKLHAATGWRPTIGLDRTLKEVADAQAD